MRWPPIERTPSTVLRRVGIGVIRHLESCVLPAACLSRPIRERRCFAPVLVLENRAPAPMQMRGKTASLLNGNVSGCPHSCDNGVPLYWPATLFIVSHAERAASCTPITSSPGQIILTLVLTFPTELRSACIAMDTSTEKTSPTAVTKSALPVGFPQKGAGKVAVAVLAPSCIGITFAQARSKPQALHSFQANCGVLFGYLHTVGDPAKVLARDERGARAKERVKPRIAGV